MATGALGGASPLAMALKVSVAGLTRRYEAGAVAAGSTCRLTCTVTGLFGKLDGPPAAGWAPTTTEPEYDPAESPLEFTVTFTVATPFPLVGDTVSHAAGVAETDTAPTVPPFAESDSGKVCDPEPVIRKDNPVGVTTNPTLELPVLTLLPTTTKVTGIASGVLVAPLAANVTAPL